MKHYISFSGVSKSYNGIKVLENISLGLDRGAIVSIVGQYGSGKTTILRLLSGLEYPDSGDILIDGKAPQQLIKERKIGYAFQESNLLDWRTVLKNLTLPNEICEQNGISRAKELLDQLSLPDIAAKYPDQISGGTKHLVSIARAIALHPDILLLDEPFSSVDEINRDNLHEKLIKLHDKNGFTTILVTHSIHEAAYLSDFILVIGGTPGTIREKIIGSSRRRVLSKKYCDEMMDQMAKIRKALRQ